MDALSAEVAISTKQILVKAIFVRAVPFTCRLLPLDEWMQSMCTLSGQNVNRTPQAALQRVPHIDNNPADIKTGSGFSAA